MDPYFNVPAPSRCASPFTQLAGIYVAVDQDQTLCATAAAVIRQPRSHFFDERRTIGSEHANWHGAAILSPWP
jgi:hypothetical protein